jgi:hypothetical protein
MRERSSGRMSGFVAVLAGAADEDLPGGAGWTLKATLSALWPWALLR